MKNIWTMSGVRLRGAHISGISLGYPQISQPRGLSSMTHEPLPSNARWTKGVVIEDPARETCAWRDLDH